MIYDLKESGMRIKAMRKSKGITQEKLAEEVGLSLEAISKIERGIRGASVEVLYDISRYFDTEMEYVAFGIKKTVDFYGIEMPKDKLEMVKNVVKAIVE